MSEETLFHEALAKSPAERAAFLDAACAGQPELRQAVEELLAAHAASGSLLDQPAVDPNATGAYVPAAVDDAVLEKAGSRIGPYKLLQKLGEGGMGAVFLAEQEKPVQRRVALKIIKAGLDSRHVLARFEAERQALAMMDHPNIAKVLDAGVVGQVSNLSSGERQVENLPHGNRPYFVMELVKGIPITKYCDQEHLTPKERLDLFIPVCQAVQHAHQKGIIHRDIKPSNVIVALYDGRPVPKVIDFGVAKATQQKLTEKTMFTEVGQIVGTLEYMAPEQAELNNLDIDTRADIYSLGVLLYELLTGSPPFTSEKLRSAGFVEMLRMIREVEPHKPSTRLSSSAELPSIAARRKLEPKRLTRLIKGDLDWIIMKALEKDRGRRYDTANALAGDIQRYLNLEPVLAGPPSVSYRVRKFVRKHRPAVVAVAAVVLGTLAAVAGQTWNLYQAYLAENKARTAEQQATADRDKARAAEQKALRSAEEARQAAQLANEMARFLQHDLLGQADPDSEPDRNLSLRTVLDRAAVRLENRFPSQPMLEAALRDMVGSSYHNLGEYAAAQQQFARVYELVRQAHGDEHDFTLGTLGNMARTATVQQQYRRAEQLWQQVLAVQRRRHGPEHPGTLGTQCSLGWLFLQQRQWQEAERLLVPTLAAQRRLLGDAHPETLRTSLVLGQAYAARNRHTEAEPLLVQAWEGRRQLLGERHSATLNALHAVATLRRDQGQFAAAENLYRQELDRRRQVLGRQHPDTLSALYGYATVSMAQGKYAQAEPLFRVLLADLRQLTAPEDPRLRAPLSDFGTVLLRLDRAAEAEPMLRELLALQQKLDPADWRTFSAQCRLGQALADQGKYAEAEPLLLQGYAGMKLRAKAIPAGRVRYTDALERLVQLYQATGKKEEAAKWRQELEAMKAKPADKP